MKKRVKRECGKENEEKTKENEKKKNNERKKRMMIDWKIRVKREGKNKRKVE